MSRLFYLVIFLLTSYWRKTKFIIQFTILVLIMGIFLNPNYAPYSYGYVVLIKNVYFIVFSLITSFHVSKLNNNQEIYILLNRVKRSWVYLSSLLTAMFIIFLLGILVDTYILLFAGLSFLKLFNLSFVIYSVINLLLATAVGHLFSFYVVKAKYCILGFVLLTLGFIPKWYQGLPAENIFSFLSYLVPPLGLNIIQQQAESFSMILVIYSLIYFLITVTAGSLLIKKRSFVE